MRIDLGFTPRRWQAEVLARLKRFSVVIVHRQGGKTELAIAKLVDAALRAQRPLSRFGYVAPLLKQAKAIAWDRLKAYARKVPGTVINESELSAEFQNGARVRLFGADNPDSLRGLVFDGIVVDEVAQMALQVWGEILLPTLTARDGWALFIGTPKGINLLSDLYYKALDLPKVWFAARYNCYETDALDDEKIAAAQAELTDAQFRQEYLCDFSASSDNTLIPLELAIAASKRNLRHEQFDFAPRILGVDVAWDGGDRSVIAPRQGLCAFRPRVEKGLPEKRFSSLVASAILYWKPAAVFVDTTGGYGGEVVSRLRDLGHTVQEVIFSWKASDERFLNLRAEMWFKMAEWIRQGAAIPPDTALISELCAPSYDNDNASNRLRLESKADVRARIGASVDIADAYALTFAFPVGTSAGTGKANIDFDPFATRDEIGKVDVDFDPYNPQL